MQQILWTEIALKAAAGLLLLIAPQQILTIAGLARPIAGLWPRLVGALLLAISASIWLGLQYPGARGAIGPAALVPLNLMPAAVLASALIMGTAAPTRRGKVAIGLSAMLLAVLGFLEIAHS